MNRHKVELERFEKFKGSLEVVSSEVKRLEEELASTSDNAGAMKHLGPEYSTAQLQGYLAISATESASIQRFEESFRAVKTEKLCSSRDRQQKKLESERKIQELEERIKQLKDLAEDRRCAILEEKNGLSTFADLREKLRK